MPRIEPIPLDQLSPESYEIITEGFGDGLYSTQVPLQIFAYKSAQLAGVHQARTGGGKGTLLGGRILELIRIRSAQLGECQPCMQSRKHDSITDDDVACLLAPVRGDLTDQEAMAVEFLDLLSADHHAIDAEFYERLAAVFTAAQIVELGFVCANTMGLHRFLHTLDLFGSDAPVIAYDPAQVDTAKPDSGGPAGGVDATAGSVRGVSTILVTGGTGLTGSNVCRQLIGRGDQVRALVRPTADVDALAAMGVDLVTGDITQADDVRRAAEGCEAAIHSAALLGASQQDMVEFEAVNTAGTTHVLDAAAAVGMRRVVALSTSTFFDSSSDLPLEDAPVSEAQSTDPYNKTKLAAFEEAHARADAGQDIVTCHPGAIFGPAPVVSRALAPTSFNRVLRGALRGKLTRYLRFPVSWVLASDVAWGSISALDNGVSGERYLLDGRPEDVISIAAACNLLCELAGIDNRVEDVAPSDDPELAAMFGPTLMAIASAPHNPGEASARTMTRATSRTHTRLGYDPTSLDDGLRQLLAWLRQEDQVRV